MPKLVQLYIRQSAIGFAVAAAFVGVLLYFNVANLWYLVTHTADGPLALGLLWFFNGIVFSAVQFGIAVMALGRDDEPKGGTRDPVAIPVRADDRRR